MANLVLKVQENFNPKDGDILVYNSRSMCWEATTKDFVLREIYSEIKKIKDELKEQSENAQKIESNVEKIAEIVKENVL